MSKELIVSSGRHETRVAILEDDQVVELFHEREKEYSLAGSIHKGRVTRVLPGMQSAFVDIGLDRDAFLYVSDFFEDNDEYDAVVSTVEEKVLKMERAGGAISTAVSTVDAGPEPVRNLTVAVPAEESSNGEMPRASAGAVAPAIIPGSTEQKPQESGRDGRGDRGDRGGRGRRGRRRRGGRPSGLPDSKFFSPGTEPAAGPEAEKESESVSEAPPSVYAPAHSYVEASYVQAPTLRTSQSDADLVVLPGESLAKYSADSTKTGNNPENEAAGTEGPSATISAAAGLLDDSIDDTFV